MPADLVDLVVGAPVDDVLGVGPVDGERGGPVDRRRGKRFDREIDMGWRAANDPGDLVQVPIGGAVDDVLVVAGRAVVDGRVAVSEGGAGAHGQVPGGHR